MQNDKEFSDQSQGLDPKILEKVNPEGGNATRDSTTQRSSGSDANTPEDLSSIDTFDVTAYKALPNVSKHFETLQSLFDLVYNGLRVPYSDQNFRKIQVPKSRNGVPVLPYQYFVSEPNLVGGGDAYFNAVWTNAATEAQFVDFVDEDGYFEVKMDAKTASVLLTDVTIWSNDYLDKGVRDSRARPNVVLGDFGCFLPPTFSTTKRRIRTDAVACYMYGAYIPTTPASTITVINADDLKAFMNTTGGKYWPVDQRTLCLSLAQIPAAVLPKLAIFAQPVIIDFDSSMDSTRGTLTSWNGCPAWQVSLTSTVAPCDIDVATMLQYTFSATDIQWATFANTLPLSHNTTNTPFANSSSIALHVYSNTIADQFINFYKTHRDAHNCLPLALTQIPSYIQAWRVIKTCCVNRTLVELGYIGGVYATNSIGKPLTAQNLNDCISGSWQVKSNNALFNLPCVCWTPYELWIQNGANIKLDDEDYVDGESSVLVNCNYNAPKSQVRYSSITSWADSTSPNFNYSYYMPNSSSAVMNVTSGYNLSSACACTVPRYSSTTETMSLQWNKEFSIDFTYSRSGKNRNTIHRKKMVFSVATKN